MAVNSRTHVLRFVILCLSALVCGCSQQQAPHPGAALESLFHSGKGKAIWVHHYREDSIKAQPELLSLYSDKTEQIAVVDWISGSEKVEQLRGTADSLFILQFEYETANKVSDYAYMMYVETREGEHYLKPFTMGPKFHLDSYKQEDGDAILSSVGMDQWYKLDKALHDVFPPAATKPLEQLGKSSYAMVETTNYF
ncbi:hypothetical protein I532_03315 [Brevibacillus borstelensis AK1]|uniref:Lipoprotein n=1 Tax=Brevibacillus borstelensis AK1 TaxID=1300222 RepID=M8E5U2_9BACL|nr:hypothetical protein [Brevibacillus borstelensis]EMT54601.1 hypothetical protein I532_03315 [Brevibacillus borstelensis AK1]KKX54306.1 hypothetical protein X546_14785 [Brevibacillus borstelensis cifa_chp40]MED1850171.1 hypothetical protein [Brevibacillus borstelensis]